MVASGLAVGFQRLGTGSSQCLGRLANSCSMLWLVPALAELVGHANAVEDGAVVRGAVADDAHAAHAQQRRAAVFAVVQAAAEIVEGAGARAARPPAR